MRPADRATHFFCRRCSDCAALLGGRVTTVEKGVNEYLGEPGVRRHFQHGVDMIFVTVNPAG